MRNVGTMLVAERGKLCDLRAQTNQRIKPNRSAAQPTTCFWGRPNSSIIAKSRREEFLSLLTSGSKNVRLADTLITQILEAAPQQSFDPSALGGGAWTAVYTSGPLLWQAYTNLFSLLRLDNLGSQRRSGQILIGASNKASQAFDPTTFSVLNSGQFFGDVVQVTAEGSFKPKNAATTYPKEFEVEINGGTIVVLGKTVQLPIRGRGSFSILYVDDTLRIFQSPSGTLSVQVRDDKLQKLLA